MAELTQADRDRMFQRVVGDTFLEQLDTTLGTVEVAKLVASGRSACGGVGPAADGPYSDGKNAEYWSFRYDQVRNGFRVRIDHTIRKTGRSTTLREGIVTWNELANRATVTALLRRPDEQLALIAA